MRDVIVGLDIGSETVRAVIGVYSDIGKLEIIGVGTSPSSGLKKGAIVNIETVARSIQGAIEAAEQMAGCDAYYVNSAIGSEQTSSVNSTGAVGITGNGKGSVCEKDIQRVLDSAKAIPLNGTRKILHVIPQTYIVDKVNFVQDPMYMEGTRLGVDVHIVEASITSIQNIEKAIERANYKRDTIFLNSLAAVKSITTKEERELGSIVIDFGAESTDAIVVCRGAPICSVSVPFGGRIVSQDISYVRGISTETAERIKKSSGCCHQSLLEENEEVIIPGVGGRPPELITRLELCSYIQPRIEEILTMVRDKIGSSISDENLSGNVILCGGGALLPGIVEVAGEVFCTSNVRIGIPGNYDGVSELYRSPEYAVAVGLILEDSFEDGTLQNRMENDKKKQSKFSAIADWFKEFF